jgi:L-threonylcarbamoyladenylate synthase
MLRLTIGSSLDAAQFAPAVDALHAGGVVAFPTETFYGLAVDPRSPAAVAKLFALKRRPPDQPLPLIAADIDQVADHVGTLTPLAKRIAAQGWPGALTLIIPASRRLCEEVHLSTGRVAVRVPGDGTARVLALHAGHAITSTSANLSGAPPASTADRVAAVFSDGIDVLLDGGATPGGLPSTIVDATGDAPVLVRAGVVPWDRVLRFSK